MSHVIKRIIMPSITMRRKDGSIIGEVKSHIVVVTAGSTTHCLHLHKSPQDHWVVSDPRTGGMVLVVRGMYKGCPVSTKGFSLKEVRGMAHAQVEGLIEAVGSDRFNAVLEGAGKTLASTV
jgi:hypothetical protein